ncbi:hypothetical protein B0H13DRAFT_1972139, partial [Mycena leptocephala]
MLLLSAHTLLHTLRASTPREHARYSHLVPTHRVRAVPQRLCTWQFVHPEAAYFAYCVFVPSSLGLRPIGGRKSP